MEGTEGWGVAVLGPKLVFLWLFLQFKRLPLHISLVSKFEALPLFAQSIINCLASRKALLTRHHREQTHIRIREVAFVVFTVTQYKTLNGYHT